MTATRMEVIETKLAYLEHTVEELNQTIYDQQKQIDRQQALIDSLVEHVRALEDTAPDGPAANERPPHY